MGNDAEVSIKFKNQVTGEKKLEKYANTLKQINNVLSGMDIGITKQLESSASDIKQIDKNVDNMSNQIGVAFNFAAVTRFAGAIKKLGAGFTSLAKQSFDYLENFNLFQVAFKGNYESAERFINTMSEMYGLDESWLTQTVGKFKQLTNAMQLTEETGEKVSKLLTQMSLDISSLYNVDIERAASTLSSAMAGQTKPIRGVAGADITQTTLQTTLDQLGIDAAVNKLSFAEKRLLIIISLTKQLNASIGDMGRTIESPSNQLRIMNEQWKRLSRAVGNVFLPILSKILPYLNAILMVLTEIISTIATLLGYKRDDFDYFDSAATGAWDLDEGLKSAGSSAKKLKQGLRGFDKLNVITTPTKTSTSVGSGVGGINPKLMEAFNAAFDNYQKKLDKVDMLATRIRDKIMNWLGFTKDISFKLKEGYSNFKLIVGLISTIAGFKLLKGLAGLITGTSRLGKLLGTGGLYNTIKKILEVSKVLGAKDGILYVFYDSKLGKSLTTLTSGFSKLASALGLSSGALFGIIAVVAALTVAFVKLYKNNDEFRKKVNKLSKTIKSTFTPVLKTVKTVIESLIKIIGSFLNKVIMPLINTLMKILTPILNIIVDILQDIYDTLQPIIEKIFNTLTPIIKDITKYLTDDLFPILGKIFDVIGSVFEALSPILSPILKGALEMLLIPIKGLANLIDGIFTVIDWLYTNLVKPFLDWVVKKIEEKVIPAIKGISSIVDTVKKAIQKVVDWWNNLKFNTKTVKIEGLFTSSSGLEHTKASGRHEYADGGLPPVGQLFVANERGAELVGHIGGKTFVANQNQMMDLLDKKLGQAKANQSISPTIIVQVGNKEIAKQVINDLQDMAKTNGRPITIGN